MTTLTSSQESRGKSGEMMAKQALARAAAALAAGTEPQNTQNLVNTAQLGPALNVSQTLPALVTKGTRPRITCMFSGTCDAANVEVTAQLVRGATNIGVPWIGESGGGSFFVAGTLDTLDFLSAPGSEVYLVSISAGVGHTITIPIGQLQLTAQDG